MASWKTGAAKNVMTKVQKGHALSEMEIKTLQGIAGRPKYPLRNPPIANAVFLTEEQLTEQYRQRIEKERIVAPNAPDEGDMMLPFVTQCERRAEDTLRHGPNPVAWHGKFKLGFDTNDTVDTLFVDSEYTRIKLAERDQLRSLKAQLREERTKRRALERTATSMQEERRKEAELEAEQLRRQAAEAQAAALLQQKKFRLPPRSLRPQVAVTQEKLRPVRMGGTGYGAPRGTKPQCFHDLHPAAQAVLKYAIRTGEMPRPQPAVPHRLPAIASEPAVVPAHLKSNFSIF